MQWKQMNQITPFLISYTGHKTSTNIPNVLLLRSEMLRFGGRKYFDLVNILSTFDVFYCWPLHCKCPKKNQNSINYWLNKKGELWPPPKNNLLFYFIKAYKEQIWSVGWCLCPICVMMCYEPHPKTTYFFTLLRHIWSVGWCLWPIFIVMFVFNANHVLQ